MAGGAVFVVILLGAVVNMMRPGGKLWYMASEQESLKTYQLKKGQFCSEAREPEKINWYATFLHGIICGSEPIADYSTVFDRDIKFIFYGEIEKIKSYALEGSNMRDGKKVKPVPYYCHVVTVKVQRDIFGGVPRNRRVNLLCRWKYLKSGESDELDWEHMEEGKKAVFFVNGNASKIQVQEEGRSIDILGTIPHERGSRVLKCKKFEGLDRIGSKDEAFSYYKKHRIVYGFKK